MKYEIRNVVGYENLYMVDTEGNVFSTKKGGLKLLKPGKDTNGYLYVRLYKYNICKNLYVHRLVLLAFNPNVDSDNLTVNHKDENKKNNNIENLEWLTRGDNTRYSQAKPIVQLDKNDKLIGVYESSRIAQEKTGCDQSSIIKCVKGQKKYKTCGGYKWMLYEDYLKLTKTNKGEDLID